MSREWPPNNLPYDLTTFVGREREAAEIEQALGEWRLVTLMGAGGVGKTRLALRVAGRLKPRYADGVWFVELAALVDPGLVTQTIAATIGVRPQGGRSMAETLVDALHTSELLLVLDNCEHLISSCAEIAEQLLRAAPRLKLLATSREPLGVPGEVQWRVPSLTVSEPDAETTADVRPTQSDAVQLFAARASTVLPGFSLDERNTATVAHICSALDGLPLAIELAAARIRVLSPEQIAERLSDRLRLLAGGDRTAPPRQRTIRGAIDWSYELLSDQERLLFDRLSVFAGGFSLEAVESVCAGDGMTPENALDLLVSLVDKSLVLTEPRAVGNENGFRLLETLRAYGRERLVDRDEAERGRRRLAAYVVGMAEEADSAFHGPDQAEWLQRAEWEHDNVRASLQWAIEEESDEAADIGLRLAGALSWSWVQHERWRESVGWYESVLSLPAAGKRNRPRARALVGAGNAAIFQGSYAAAAAWLEEGLSISHAIHDDSLMATAIASLGLLVQFFPGLEFADGEIGELVRQAWNDPVAFMRRGGLPIFEIWALFGLSAQLVSSGDYGGAGAQLEEALRIARGAQDTWATAMALNQLGDVARCLNDPDRALGFYEESLQLIRRLGGNGEASLFHNLGYVALARGENERAAALFREALMMFRRSGDRHGMADGLIGLGNVAAAEGLAADAAALFGTAEATHLALGTSPWPANQASYEHFSAMAHAKLGETEFARCLAAGGAAGFDEVVADAFRTAIPARPMGSETGTSSQPGSRPRGADLTPREREVAVLVAQGLSNRDIADRLVITEKTAANHVQHVLDKLAVHSRAQVAAQAHELGLAHPASTAGTAPS